jgi:hypothetical protein
VTFIDAHSLRSASASSLAEQYANPDVRAPKLLNSNKHPHVVVEVRKAMAWKELAAERKADDVLRYIHTAMWFCPGDRFDPGGKGGWLISQDAYRELPPEIKRLIEEVELRTVETGSGTTHKLWVRFLSKTAMSGLAAKHQLGEKVQLAGKVQAEVAPRLSWDIFCCELFGMEQKGNILAGPATGGATPNRIDHIDEAHVNADGPGMPASAPAPAPPVNRLSYSPSRNGDGEGHQ